MLTGSRGLSAHRAAAAVPSVYRSGSRCRRPTCEETRSAQPALCLLESHRFYQKRNNKTKRSYERGKLEKCKINIINLKHKPTFRFRRSWRAAFLFENMRFVDLEPSESWLRSSGETLDLVMAVVVSVQRPPPGRSNLPQSAVVSTAKRIFRS